MMHNVFVCVLLRVSTHAIGRWSAMMMVVVVVVMMLCANVNWIMQYAVIVAIACIMQYAARAWPRPWKVVPLP